MDNKTHVYIVSGASAVGKSTLVPCLRRLMPDWAVFDSDCILGGPANVNDEVKKHLHHIWLRLANSIHESGRRTLICGVFHESQFKDDFEWSKFCLHWAVLHCEPQQHLERLAKRKACKTVISESLRYDKIYYDFAAACGGEVIDTTHLAPEQTAERVYEWAMRTAQVADLDNRNDSTL